MLLTEGPETKPISCPASASNEKSLSFALVKPVWDGPHLWNRCLPSPIRQLTWEIPTTRGPSYRPYATQEFGYIRSNTSREPRLRGNRLPNKAHSGLLGCLASFGSPHRPPPSQPRLLWGRDPKPCASTSMKDHAYIMDFGLDDLISLKCLVAEVES